MIRRRSLRVRMTAAFAIAFTLGAAALLGAAYAIVAESTGGTVRPTTVSIAAAPGRATRTRHHSQGAAPTVRLAGDSRLVPLAAVQSAQAAEHADDLHRVVWWFAAALVAVVCSASAVGWFVAGRALAPLRRITDSAGRVSPETLDARLALDGPRDELHELADTFDAMLERLDRAFAAQRRFVADASHELRTPLALARTEAEVVLEDPDASAGQLREALAQIQRTTVRGGELVDALLRLARADATTPDAERVRLDTTVTEATASARDSARMAGLALEVEAECRVAVSGDAILLRAVVDNLLANAIAYNAPGGWVKVTLGVIDGEAKLSAENTGPILERDGVDGLFEPFVRAEPSRSRRTGGAGLGLAIVRAVAVAHGGRIEAHARPAGGMAIAVLLPMGS